MDPETMRNLISTMQVEMNTLRSNQENVTQTFILQQREMERQRQELAAQQEEVIRRQREAVAALKAALQLARGAQAAPP